jgi:hypothetical protein
VAPPQFSSPPPSRDPAPTYSAPIDEDPGLSPSRWVKALVLDPPVTVSIPVLGAQALLQLGLLVWGASFVTAPVDSDRILESFMHLIHLPFHEFGHLFFSPLGTFMQFLGGTLGQLLMPLICLFTLLIRTRDPFGAAVCLWWLGQSFIDCAPYINDATRLRLVMVSGELAKDTAGHDWENILSMLGWLRYDHTLAVLSHRLGSLLIVLSWVWGISLIRLQLQRLRAGDTRRRLM